MIIDLGNIVIGKLANLPFIDKYAGVVKPVTFSDEGAAGKINKKTFPVACNVTTEECTQGQYKDLVPDSTKMSVTYLEDKYVRFVKREGDKYFFQASFDLISWLNLPKMGLEQCSVSSKAIMSIMTAFPAVPINEGIFQQLLITPLGQDSKSRNPFAKWSYDTEATQFLMYPYDYFLLPLQVDFVVNRKCIADFQINDPLGCNPLVPNCCDETPVPSPYLTCTTLASCEAITSILDRLDTLEADQGGDFDCSLLAGCQTIIDIQEQIDVLGESITATNVNLTNDISQEAQNRLDADVFLQNNINAEALARSNADDDLQDNIDQEISDRQAADTTLQSNIAAEASTRATNDSILNGMISSEATARANADATLQSQIDDEVAARENADIQTLADANAYTDSKLVGAFNYRGYWDGTAGDFPETGGTGSGGDVQQGNAWEIQFPCTIHGEDYDAGDLIVAKVDSPGQVIANWADSEHNTQQANETTRGTAKTATQATIEDNTTANDADYVSAKKFWLGIAKALTLSSFFNAVLGTLLTGLSLATGTAVVSTDSVLVAIGKLQKQITDLTTVVSGKFNSSDVDTDGTLAANSDAKVASQKATKTYADTKISHSLATAVSDFLIASGAGVFVKKTLAETKTILGLVFGTTAGTYAEGNDARFGASISWLTGNLSPADSTTYYMGYCRTLAPTITETDQDFTIGRALVITDIIIAVSNTGTSGSNIDVPVQVRNVTQGTSHPIGNIRTTTSNQIATFNGLNIPVAATDFITQQLDAPAYVTNPTNVSFAITYFFKWV